MYHNVTKYAHNAVHQDIWENPTEPYQSNEQEVYIKLELDPEAVEKAKQNQKHNKNIGVQGVLSRQNSAENLEGAEEQKEGEEEGQEATSMKTARAPLPGELQRPESPLDSVIVACAPYPTNKPHENLPRYVTKVKQVGGDLIDQKFLSYFGGVKFNIVGDAASQ